MSPLTRLTGAAFGIHFADQISLVCVPLIAALAFDASPTWIGILVACQSLAHLLGSLPFGVLVDHAQQRSLAIGAALLCVLGFLAASAAVGWNSLPGFGLAITTAGFGVVLFMLTALSILPKTADSGDLETANAAIELPRALGSFSVPLVVGLVVSAQTAGWFFPIAVLFSVWALVFALGLPRFAMAPPDDAQPLFARVYEGGRFVIAHPLLRAISLCAIFWNIAFSALLVTMVPLLRDVLGQPEGIFGIAFAIFGFGALSGTWISKRFAARIAPKYILILGPAFSVLAAGILFATPLMAIGSGTVPAIYLAFFLIGLLPSMWLIAQNALRQTVSPPGMLGRVNAVIQTAIYGIRPLAAIIAGLLVAGFGPQAGLGLVVLGFTFSLVVAVFSGLRRVDSFASLLQG